MNHYEEEIELYFELKGSPASSKESYMRRMQAFIAYLQDKNISIEELTEGDIQQYILECDGGRFSLVALFV
jgi:site-specific recombinase XerD